MRAPGVDSSSIVSFPEEAAFVVGGAAVGSIVDRAAVVVAAVNGPSDVDVVKLGVVGGPLVARAAMGPDRDVVPVPSLEVVAVAGPLSTLAPVLFFFLLWGCVTAL